METLNLTKEQRIELLKETNLLIQEGQYYCISSPLKYLIVKKYDVVVDNEYLQEQFKDFVDFANEFVKVNNYQKYFYHEDTEVLKFEGRAWFDYNYTNIRVLLIVEYLLKNK